MTTDSRHSGSDRAGPSAAFDHLHERVRAWVYRQKWTVLRDIQEEAVEPILAAESDLVISAGTASGKTEAAFLPICSELVETTTPGVHAIYVGPLKALINDQFERLERLCEDLAVPVHRWHGDVGSAEKRKVVREPSGILLITPESLEALFVLRGRQIARIFAPLRHVVIDELHAYLGSERGRQLQSLLHRLETALGRRVQRIGLSATLGNLRLAADALRPGHGDEALILESSGGDQELRLQVRGYRDAGPVVVAGDEMGDEAEEPTQVSPKVVVAQEGLHAVCDDLFQILRGSNNLIFANSRTLVEGVSDRLVRLCQIHKVPVEFHAHHGSLSKGEREFVEDGLKRGDRPASAVCTCTLELGMDIGRVKSVALIGPPHTVASLRQRIGRSGRRGDPGILRSYCIEREISERSPPQDRVRPQIVQTVAMVQLLLEGWCEPPVASAYHFSTLVQQTLSYLRERGGATAQEAWTVLCKRGAFRAVTAAQYADLLRDLRGHDLVAQLEDDTLVLGLGGEKLTDHFSFYTAFQTEDEWSITTEGRVLGTLPVTQPLMPGLFLVLAGRRWRVVHVDPERRDVFVLPARGGVPPQFGGEGGEVHDRVRQEMRSVLLATDVPVYLDARARDLLTEAREQFARLGLVEQGCVTHGSSVVWFPWMGDRVMNTLVVELVAQGLAAMRDGVAITVNCVRADDLHNALLGIARRGPADPLALAATVENTRLEKHDLFLRDALLHRDYAAKRLDTQGAYDAACKATQRPSP